MLHSSSSTRGSSQGFLQQKAGTTWRLLLPAAVQQETPGATCPGGEQAAQPHAVAAEHGPAFPCPGESPWCRLPGWAGRGTFPQGIPGLAVRCISSGRAGSGWRCRTHPAGAGQVGTGPWEQPAWPPCTRTCCSECDPGTGQPMASRTCWAGELLCRAQPATSQSCLGVFTSLPAVTPPPL